MEDHIMESDLSFEPDPPKKLEAFGLSAIHYSSAQDARGNTYTTKDDRFPPTPFLSPINPFNADILASKNVLEIGCGVGRNLPFIMEKTVAHYYGIEPNDDMTNFFWQVQDPTWKSRVTLCKTFEELPPDILFDFVIVTFVFQHIGFRPRGEKMNVADITLEAMKHTKTGTVWFVLEHEREEIWQDKWMKQCNIRPDIFIKPGGTPFGDGEIPYEEFRMMTHRGNDHNIIIFKENKNPSGIVQSVL